MAKYFRLCTKVKEPGILLSEEDVKKEKNNLDRELYLSTYYYNDQHYSQFKKTGSIAGIRDVLTNTLWFDFDSEDDPSIAQKDALVVIERLKAARVPERNVEVYFSGRKGFDVRVTLKDRVLTPDQVKSLIVNKFGKDIPTLDLSMYDAPQLLRVPGSKHKGSGLVKIPLTVDELRDLTIQEIKNKAVSLDNVSDGIEWDVTEVDEAFLDYPKVEEPKKIVVPNSGTPAKNWKDYRWSLLQGHFGYPGKRHDALLRLAATCRAMGYDEDTTTFMCLAADSKHCLMTGDHPVDDLENDIIPSIYSDTWKGGQYSPQSDPWLADYCKRLGFDVQKSEAIRISDLKDGFYDYVSNIEANTILTGIPRLDKEMPLTIGMNLGIVGAPSAGKTAIALNILKNTSAKGVVSVFASLDMHRNRLFEKLLYKETRLPREELYKKIKNKELDSAFEKIKKDYENVYFYDRSCPSVKDIRSYIEEVEAKTGKKVKLVMIDYFERVNSDKSEDTAASKDVAGQLQDLINDFNICLVTLVQPNKFSLSGGPDSPIKSYTAIKGSSFLYQSFRSIISIWRPFFTPEWKDHDKYLQMAILKNDLGELNLFTFGWEGKTGAITELDYDQFEEFNELFGKKKENEEKNQGNSWS